MKMYEKPKIVVKPYPFDDIFTDSFDGDYIDEFNCNLTELNTNFSK